MRSGWKAGIWRLGSPPQLRPGALNVPAPRTARRGSYPRDTPSMRGHAALGAAYCTRHPFFCIAKQRLVLFGDARLEDVGARRRSSSANRRSSVPARVARSFAGSRAARPQRGARWLAFAAHASMRERSSPLSPGRLRRRTCLECPRPTSTGVLYPLARPQGRPRHPAADRLR